MGVGDRSHRGINIRRQYLALALLLPLGLAGCPAAGSADLRRDNQAERGGMAIASTSGGSSDAGDRPTAETGASSTPQRQPPQSRRLTPPPAKAPADELERWWQEINFGPVAPDAVQQRMPTERLADWLTDAYRQGVAPAQVQAALQAARWQNSADQLQAVDLDQDGQEEWLVTLNLLDPEFVMWGAPGDFWVIGNGGLDYRFFTPDRYFDNDYETQPEFFLSAPLAIATPDMTGDGAPEVVLERRMCGAHTCTYFYYILSNHTGTLTNTVRLSEPNTAGTITMTYAEVQPIADATGDGLPDFLIHGGWVGSAGSGIQRTRTEVWAWDGDAIALAETQLDPTDYRYHLLWEANDEMAAGNLEGAIRLYTQVIEDESLDDEGAFADAEAVYDSSRQFAAFRLSLIALMQSNEAIAQQWRDWLAQTYGSAPLVEAAELLLSTAQTESLEQSCAAVTTYLKKFEVVEGEWVTESPTGALRDLGYANPSLTAVDVCPL